MEILKNIINILGNNIKYIVIVVIILILYLIIRSIVKKYQKRENHVEKLKTKTYTINDCRSNEDLEFKIDLYQKKINDELSKNKNIIQAAKEKGYIKVDIAWTERFQELNEVSYVLNKNLEYENAKKLANDNFHRYTSLHFRSHIIGNLAYEDYIASKRVRDEISDLLVLIGKRELFVSANEKRELYTIKDTCVNTTKYLYERMVSIQSETGRLRDKIRDECGNRGIEWYKKIMSNRK